MGVCLDRESIARYGAGACLEDERRAIEVHLAECENCRDQTTSMRLDTSAARQADVTRVPAGRRKPSSEKTNGLDGPAKPSPRSTTGKKRPRAASTDVTRVMGHEKTAGAGGTPADEKTRVMEKSDAAQTRVDLGDPSSSSRGSVKSTEQTVSLTDARSGQGVSPAMTPASDGRQFAKALESMIDGYEVLEEMPRGGQAAVYKAMHTATKTKVAIKVLLPTLLASARARYYFEREAELIASLDHPNIIAIRDSGIIHQQYYFVMQYVEGQPLARYVRLQKLSFRQIVVLFNKICMAISYAHQQGVIHRDLKSAKIP